MGYFYPYFLDEVTVAQRAWKTCPKLPSSSIYFCNQWKILVAWRVMVEVEKIKEVHLCFPGHTRLDSLFSFTNLFPFSSHLSLLEVSHSSSYYLDAYLLSLWLWFGTLPHFSHSRLSQWSLRVFSLCWALCCVLQNCHSTALWRKYKDSHFTDEETDLGVLSASEHT